MTVAVVPPTSTGGSGQSCCSCSCLCYCCIPVCFAASGSRNGESAHLPLLAAITSYRVVGVPVNPAGGKNITLTGMGGAGAGTSRTFSYGAGSYVQGQQYRFYAYATNAVGEGPPSPPTAPFTAPVGCVGFT